MYDFLALTKIFDHFDTTPNAASIGCMRGTGFQPIDGGEQGTFRKIEFV